MEAGPRDGNCKCFVCGEEITIAKMRDHVGRHIVASRLKIPEASKSKISVRMRTGRCTRSSLLTCMTRTRSVIFRADSADAWAPAPSSYINPQERKHRYLTAATSRNSVFWQRRSPPSRVQVRTVRSCARSVAALASRALDKHNTTTPMCSGRTTCPLISPNDIPASWSIRCLRSCMKSPRTNWSDS